MIEDIHFSSFQRTIFEFDQKKIYYCLTLLIVLVFIECHASERKVKALLSCEVNLLSQTRFSWLHKLRGTFLRKVRLRANFATESSFQLNCYYGYISIHSTFLWKCHSENVKCLGVVPPTLIPRANEDSSNCTSMFTI